MPLFLYDSVNDSTCQSNFSKNLQTIKPIIALLVYYQIYQKYFRTSYISKYQNAFENFISKYETGVQKGFSAEN